jgi:hypothetical protein
MVKITYKPAATGEAVFVAGKRLGMIVAVDGGFAYRTAGKRPLWGETFATVDAVKKSLRTDD